MTSGKQRLAPHPLCHDAIKIMDVELRLKNKTRKWLAAKSGVGERTLEEWWTGKRDPRISLVESCLQVFDMRLKPSAIERNK